MKSQKQRRSAALVDVVHSRFGSSEGAIELSIPKNNRLFANAYQNFIDSIPASVEAVFFGGPNIEVPYAPAKEIAKRLWQKRPLFGIEARLKVRLNGGIWLKNRAVVKIATQK